MAILSMISEERQAALEERDDVIHHVAGACACRSAASWKPRAYWLTAMVTSGLLVTPLLDTCSFTAFPVGVPGATITLIW